MGYLKREDILNKQDRAGVEIDIPEWGGKLILVPISIVDRIDIESLYADEDGKIDFKTGNAPFDIIIRSVIGEDGRRLFTISDIEKLKEKNAKVLFLLLQKCLEISWIGAKSTDDSKKK